MATSPYIRPAGVSHGGQHVPEHKLVYNVPNVRNNDQSPASDHTIPTTTNHTGGKSSDQSTCEGAKSDDDDEDCSGTQEDDQEEEEIDPEVLAPSQGFGKGKRDCPTICIKPIGEEESHENDEETTYFETGLNVDKRPMSPLLLSNKKRTFSNLSNTSLLFGDDADESSSFPRRKIARKLSTISSKPILTYIENTDDGQANGFVETDDEDYSGVNLISDDDSDMNNLEHLEENFIIDDEQQQTTTLLNDYNDTRRLSLDSCASDNIFDVTVPLDEAFLASISIPDIGFGQFFEPKALTSSPEPSAKRKYSDSSTKRVRFDDEVQVSDSSSSSSSELDSSVFPDLFMDQDKLPLSLYQLLENDNDDEDNGEIQSPMSDLSFWDFGQHENYNVQAQPRGEYDDSSDPDASGYETDIGDTTDEYDSDTEDAPPQTPLQNKSVLRRPSSAPGSKASSPRPFQRASKLAPTGRTTIPPTRGIFIHDDSDKAIAVTNRATKNLTFYRPRASIVSWIPLNGGHSSATSTTNNSPRTSLQHFNASDSEISNDIFNNPFTTDIMLTGIFGSAPINDNYFGGDSIGPPEAFYPFVSIRGNGTIIEEDDYEDDEEFEDDLDITDFMDFGSDVDLTDMEGEEETDVPATPATSMAAVNDSCPAQSTPMTDTPVNHRRNTSDAMLEHFDRGVVTAFRNNQNRYRDIACLPSDPDIRASVSRPIRSGKSAETLISPLRKRSMSRRSAKSTFQASPSYTTNASSPLSGVTRATSRLQNSVMSSYCGPRMGTFS